MSDREEMRKLAEILQHLVSQTITLSGEVVADRDKYTADDLTELSLKHIKDAGEKIIRLKMEVN